LCYFERDSRREGHVKEEALRSKRRSNPMVTELSKFPEDTSLTAVFPQKMSTFSTAVIEGKKHANKNVSTLELYTT